MDIDIPDCLLSFIFSKLTLKDQFKTCTLSKHWLHEWRLLSTNHNFDLYNTFHYKTLPKDLPLFRNLQSQFAARLDEFMLNYQHTTISSIRVKFPLGDQHSDVIGRLISQAIAKGVKHLELLFSCDFILEINPYTFSFTLLSNTDSLTYLHLENCLLIEPMELSGLKNLRTLVFQLIVVNQELLEGVFSNCIHLVDFSLDNCELNSISRIISPTLYRLKIVSRCEHVAPIDIIAPNLSSLEFSCNGRHLINLEAHMLSKFIYSSRLMTGIFYMSSLKNVTTVVLDGCPFLQVWFMPYMFQECLQLEDITLKNCPMPDEMEITGRKLSHLRIINCCCGRYDPCKISIDAENLSSFEYSGHATRNFSVKAPKLSKVFWNAAVREKSRNSLDPIPIFWNGVVIENNINCLGPIPKLHQIENLAIIMGHSQMSKLKVLDKFQNLRQLELFIDEAYYPFTENFSILDVLMTSQHLQKLSLTVRTSSWIGFQIQTKYEKKLHNELKYVELHGSVCTTHAIELARNLFRNVESLKKITFSSLDKFYIGAGRWTKGTDSYWFDRNFIYESLKDEVKGQCELIIL